LKIKSIELTITKYTKIIVNITYCIHIPVLARPFILLYNKLPTEVAKVVKGILTKGQYRVNSTLPMRVNLVSLTFQAEVAKVVKALVSYLLIVLNLV
jgi:hypothetical protein